MLAFYSQYYFWMPNGRILRSRFNVSQALSGDADIEDVSVYGNGTGISWRSEPGDVFTLNSSWSTASPTTGLSPSTSSTSTTERHPVTGVDSTPPRAACDVDEDSDSAWRFGIAPAIEYNWNDRVGIIFGARWFAAGRNTSAPITPAVAAQHGVLIGPAEFSRGLASFVSVAPLRQRHPAAQRARRAPPPVPGRHRSR